MAGGAAILLRLWPVGGGPPPVVTVPMRRDAVAKIGPKLSGRVTIKLKRQVR